MRIELIKGQFTKGDALTIIRKLIDVKIRFQEEKIKFSDNEEDIKMRESRIISLQKDLSESRRLVEAHSGLISLHSELHLG